MKRISTLFLMFIITISQVNSQTFDWLKTLEIDYEFNPGMIHFNTCANPQGGSYFYGMQEHVSFYNESMGVLFLKKITADGEDEWSRSISGQSCVKGMVCDENGDVYISGQMLEDAGFWGEDTLAKTGIGTDGFVARISNEGELAWCTNLSGLPMGEGTVTELVIHNNKLYVAYSTWMNTYVLIYSKDGTYLDSVVQEDVSIISDLDFDQEGNLFTTGGCAGWQASFGGVTYPAPFSYTTYLVKYNSSFEPVWVKYIEDITCTFPQVEVDDAGWIFFAGSLMNETLFDTILLNGPAWAYDFFLARLSPNGQYQWVRECPEVMTGDATVGDMHFLDTDQDGNALMTGIARGVVDWGNGAISDVTANYQDMIIWNYNPDGLVNWVKTAGGPAYDQSTTLSAGDDGGAYICGVIQGEVVFDTIIHETVGFIEPFLTRLDLDVLSGIPDPVVNTEWLVYPNPSDGKIYIKNEDGMGTYRILNSQGVSVHAGILEGPDREILLFNLPPGIYIIELRGNQSQKSITKLFIN
jgi:hypothetical protein